MDKKFSISLALLVISLILVACGDIKDFTRAMRSPIERIADTSEATLEPGTDPANGEKIYFTAIDKYGSQTQYTDGPNFGGMMMGSYLTCAACHGPDAHGGQHVMHMQTMDAPPIYYVALSNMLVEESGGTQEPGGYTLEDFRKSVVDGEHPDGDELDTDMPRWQMSDRNLSDLFAFLKTIQP